MEMNSTLFADLVEPILSKKFDGLYNSMKPEWSQIFTQEEGMKARFQETTLMFGFGLAREKPEGTTIESDQAGISYRVRMVFATYALSFAITEEMMEDSRDIDIASTCSQYLAKSMFETREIVHADVLNRSEDSSYLLGDGQTLLSASHPLGIGGTWSNKLASPADLSEASLEDLLTMLSKAVDDRGNKIPLAAEDLIVPPDLWFDSIRILRSTLQAGTANNDPNAIRSTSALPNTPIKITRLTEESGYWIKTNSPNGLMSYRRRGIKKGMEGDFSTGNMRYKSSERYTCGVENPRCLWGSLGI